MMTVRMGLESSRMGTSLGSLTTIDLESLLHCPAKVGAERVLGMPPNSQGYANVYSAFTVTGFGIYTGVLYA